MALYAKDTSVSVDKSKAEIERTLGRYGASGFMYGWNAGSAVIAFEMNGRRIMFNLALPNPKERDISHTPTGKRRTSAQQTAALEQSQRQRWRALALVIKAKLEAVESGITEFEDEFLAHIVLPNGQTAGKWMRPQIAHVYSSGEMPALLPGSRSN